MERISSRRSQLTLCPNPWLLVPEGSVPLYAKIRLIGSTIRAKQLFKLRFLWTAFLIGRVKVLRSLYPLVHDDLPLARQPANSRKPFALHCKWLHHTNILIGQPRSYQRLLMTDIFFLLFFMMNVSICRVKSPGYSPLWRLNQHRPVGQTRPLDWMKEIHFNDFIIINIF